GAVRAFRVLPPFHCVARYHEPVGGTHRVRIAELTAYHVRIPLRRPIRHASHCRTETDNILVRCLLEDGTEGFGEGVPRDYVTGETADSGLALLSRSEAAHQFESVDDFPRA